MTSACLDMELLETARNGIPRLEQHQNGRHHTPYAWSRAQSCTMATPFRIQWARPTVPAAWCPAVRDGVRARYGRAKDSGANEKAHQMLPYLCRGRFDLGTLASQAPWSRRGNILQYKHGTLPDTAIAPQRATRYPRWMEETVGVAREGVSPMLGSSIIIGLPVVPHVN